MVKIDQTGNLGFVTSITVLLSLTANAARSEPAQVSFSGHAIVDQSIGAPSTRRDKTEFSGVLGIQASGSAGEIDLSFNSELYFDGEESKLFLPEARAKFSLGDLDVLLGFDIESWSRVETVERLSILNQTDFARDFSGSTRLGELMLRTSVLTDVGWLGFYYLPFHQERLFGPELGFDPVPVYGPGRDERSPSFAFRYSNSFGDLDLEAIAFHGTDRTPTFRASQTGIEAFYPKVSQLGFGAQYTIESTFLKGEAIWTRGRPKANGVKDENVSYTFEIEHETYDPFGLGFDLTGILSYAGNSLGKDSSDPDQNDLYAGVRLAWDNTSSTELNMLFSRDLDYGSSTLSIGFEMRLFDDVQLTIDAFEVLDAKRDPALFPLLDSGSVKLEIIKYF